MAISIIKQPKAIVWSRNPILFEFSTDNRYSQEGSRYVGELNFSNGINVEDYFFILKLNGSEHQFVFKNLPDNSGLELPTINPNQTVNDWKRTVFEALNSYFPLYEYYDLSYSNNVIKLESKEKGAGFNIELLGASAGLSMSLYKVQNAQNSIIRDNFAILVEIQVQNNLRNYESFTKSVLEIDSENTAIWDIQEYINTAILKEGEPMPDFHSDEVWRENISAKKFFLRFSEMYGYPQKIMKAFKSLEYVSVLGGVRKEHEQIKSLPDFLKDGNISKWMASNATKKILPTQKDFASITNLKEDLEDIILNIKLIYSDGKVVIKEIPFGNWKYLEKLVIPVGLSQISKLLNDEIGSPTNISISLKHKGFLLSNSITYDIDYTYFPYSSFFMFQNSMGCYESIFSTGRSEYSYNVNNNEKAIEQKIESKYNDPRIKEIDIEIINEIKVRSGYKPKNEIIKFRDLFLSKSKFILQNGLYLPFVLESSSIKEHEDGNHLHAIEFTIRFSVEQTLFS